jgi:hypothetical protein
MAQYETRENRVILAQPAGLKLTRRADKAWSGQIKAEPEHP